MNKKILIQVALFAGIILILILVFFIYKSINKDSFSKKKDSEEIPLNKYENKDSNIIKNIEYFSKDKNDNQYKIKSEYGKIDPNKPNLILMENVFAEIILKNSEPIIVLSDFAIYNNMNYDTNFYKNVKLKHIYHKISCEKIDLSFNDNLVFISNNVIYKNLNTELKADKIKIDLLTKDMKIFMNENEKKVKIETKN
jgi:hypothetical protein